MKGRRDKKPCCELQMAQFKALSIKHVKQTYRNYKSTAAVFITPLMICIMLLIFQFVSNGILGGHDVNPVVKPLSKVIE